MTDPKTAAHLANITADLRPMRVEIAHDLDENGMLQLAFVVKTSEGGADVYTVLLNIETAFTMAEKLVYPFAREML